MSEDGAKPEIQKIGYRTGNQDLKTAHKLVYRPTRVPFLDYASLGLTSCAQMEMDWLRCADKTGLKRSKTECHDQFEDFLECRWGLKAVSPGYKRSLLAANFI